MTRMEKYADYRREILEMKGESENTKKHQASQKVNEILKKDDTLALSDVLSGLDIYQENTSTAEKHLNYRQKRMIIFMTVCFVVIVTILVFTILVGIDVFGGK